MGTVVSVQRVCPSYGSTALTVLLLQLAGSQRWDYRFRPSFETRYIMQQGRATTGWEKRKTEMTAGLFDWERALNPSVCMWCQTVWHTFDFILFKSFESYVMIGQYIQFHHQMVPQFFFQILHSDIKIKQWGSWQWHSICGISCVSMKLWLWAWNLGFPCFLKIQKSDGSNFGTGAGLRVDPRWDNLNDYVR